MDRQSEEQAIRAQIAKWVAAWEARKPDEIGGLYARQGKFLFPNAPISEGREACAAMWAKMMSLPNVSLTFGPVSIDVAESGDMAAELGTYRLGFDRSSGRADDRGKYVVVWRKEEGAWRAALDILNSDLPTG
jgi:uncharacterized protein (TIGR02246 family)